MSETLGANGNELTITIPSSGDLDWAVSIRNNCFQVISDHKHEGSGDGAKIRGYLGISYSDALFPNNTTILGRDNAGTGTVNLFKVNTSDELEFDGVVTLFHDDVFKIADEADTTKTLNFSLGGATTASLLTIASAHTTARTLTLPDATDTLVGRDTTDTLTNKTLTSAVLNTGVSGTAILDEDNMASDSATQLATQQSIKAYVDSQVTAQDLDIAGDSGTDAIDLDSETLTFTGGTGIDTTASSGTSILTIAIDSTVATLTGSQTLTNKTLTSPVINTGVSGTAILDEDNMASDSATQLATQQSIKAYADTKQPLDATLTSLAAYNTNGLITQTAADTFTGRTLTGTTDEIDVANGNGIAGNPTVGLADDPVIPGTGSATLPSGTEAQRPGSPTAGMIRYNSDSGSFEGYTNQWGAIGGSGAGAADTIILTEAKDAANISEMDLTGQNASFDGGGTITASSLTLSTTAADLISTDKVFKYDPNANGQNDYFGFTESIPRGFRGRSLGFSFEYKNDSAGADNDFRFCVKQKDGTNAGDIEYFDMETVYNANGTSKLFSVASYIADDCTEIEFGWQNTVTTTTVELYVDKILVSSNPFNVIDLDNITEWESYTPTFGAGFSATSSEQFYWKRVGEDLLVRGRFTADTVAAAIATVSIPSGLTIKSSIIPSASNSVVGKYFRAITSTLHGGSMHIASSSTTAINFGPSTGFSGTSDNAMNTTNGNTSFSGGDPVTLEFRVPIQGWAATSKHLVTPARVNLTEWTTYTPTFTGFGTPSSVNFQYKRVGSDLLLLGKFTVGTTTAVQAEVSLPSGLTVDLPTSPMKIGDWARSVNNAESDEILATDGDSFITFGRQSGSTNGLNPVNGTDISGTVSLQARIPIAEWAGASTEFLAAFLLQIGNLLLLQGA
jgi:hypothetical protein